MGSLTENVLSENFNSMNLVSNPVGKLQETCLKRKWTSPIYDTDDEDGPPHDRIFTVRCRLENLNIEVRGKGRSKKGAKKLAAQQMLDFLQTEGLLDNRDESDKYSGKTAKDEDNGLKETLKFIENLKNDDQLKDLMIELDIDRYDEADFCDYCRELDKIASSISCKIVYVDREENETSFALLRTSREDEPTLTILTGWGMDSDVGKARRKAAQTILIILDRMVQCKV